MADDAFDLSKTYVHLGAGATAIQLPDFTWAPDYMLNYLRTFAGERDERRLVGIVPVAETWKHWECHTGGDEVVLQLSGRCDIVQEINGEYRTIPLAAGQAVINPRGVWHTSNVHEPGQSLFIAAGRRTTYRPRNA